MPDHRPDFASFGAAVPEIYDRCLGPALFEPYAADLATRLVHASGEAVLETACGTGILTRHLRAKLAPGARLVSSDVDQGMLNYARAHLRCAVPVTWEVADCINLPLPDSSFTAMACQFGVMFVQDKEALFREARRVLATGGLLAFNVWDSLEQNPYARVTHEIIAGLFPDDPPSFFGVPYGFHDAEACRGLLRAHHFEAPKLEWLTLPVKSPTAERLARGLIYGTPVGRAIGQRTGESETVVEAVRKALALLGGDAPFQSTMRALIVTANAR